jgi:hypothetical protein
MMQTKGAGGAGVTKQSMNEMMAKAQKLPDSELADVLAGRSMQVPQFAAMLAAMGRESLRTAVAGAQAGQAKEPSRKDQMLAKMSPQPQAPAGLETLPAPNMEQMGQGMADGGIVAFSAGDPEGVKDPDKQTPAEKAMDEYIRSIEKSSVFNRPKLDLAGDFNRMLGSRYRPPRNPTITSAPTDGNIDGVTGAISTGAIPFVNANLDNQMFANIDRDVGASSPGAAPPPKTGADQTGGAPRGTAPGVAPSAVPTFESRRSAIDQLLAPTEDIAKQVASSKNQAQGEFMMQLGAALMSTPNAGVALSKGIQAGLPGLAANRKEINAVQKDQRDYRLNLSKAQEAAAQGRDDLAFKYADLAEKAKYHAGIIASRAGGGDTRMATAAMAQARAQLAEVLKNPRLSRNYATPEAQSAYLNNAFNSALSILSGQGPVTPSIPTYGALPSGEAPLTR